MILTDESREEYRTRALEVFRTQWPHIEIKGLFFGNEWDPDGPMAFYATQEHNILIMFYEDGPLQRHCFWNLGDPPLDPEMLEMPLS